MYGMERDTIHGVYKSLVFIIRNGIEPMAFETVIVPKTLSDLDLKPHEVRENKLTVNPSPQYTLMQNSLLIG